MYLDYFKLRELPFSLASDPRFLYLSEDHAKVKAYIEYAMRGEDSFLVCTGEIGTGKTTLINDALTQDHPDALIARIQINHLSSEEFLQQLLLEFGIPPYDLHRIQVLDTLKQYLRQQLKIRKKVFLIVDEAHNLSADILEDIRYLSDLESHNQKMLGVILVGQPELNVVIDQPEMEHFAQRIRLRCHIKPLNPNETLEYIKHRLNVAGSRNTLLFSEDCISVIHQFTAGRIRLINTLCDYALLHCCVEKIPRVSCLIVQKAAQELQWEVYDKRFGDSNNVTRYLLPEVTTYKAKIIVKHHSSLIDEVSITSDSIKIGRQSDNDIPLDDFKVSRYHAQIITQGNICYLHDLNSTNGTFVHEQRVSLHLLKSGESFTIGAYEFIFMQEYVPEVTPSKVMQELKDTTRQMTLNERDQTRVKYKQPYISLVNDIEA